MNRAVHLVVLTLFLLLSAASVSATHAPVSTVLPDVLKKSALGKKKWLAAKKRRLDPATAEALRTTAALLFTEGKKREASNLCLRLAEGGGDAPGYQCWSRMARYEEGAGSAEQAADYAVLALLAAEKEKLGCEHESRMLLVLAKALVERAQHSEALFQAFREITKRGLATAGTCRGAGKLIPEFSFLGKRVAEIETERTSAVVVKTETDEKLAFSSICLSFNDELPPVDSTDYAQYVRLKPNFSARYRVDAKRLCIDGADFSKKYRIEVRPGLKTAQRTVEEAQRREIRTGARRTSLWFETDSYILPVTDGRKGAMAIHSINLAAADLSIYRIPERNLQNHFMRSFFTQKLSKYGLNQIVDNNGRLVWKGKVELGGAPDRPQTHALRLPDEVTATPGVYVLSADCEKLAEREKPTQWFVVSDIGMTAYSGEDGLTVAVRRLSTALPLAGVEVRLYAKNNSILATARSDSRGTVHFAAPLLAGKRGQEPTLVAAGSGGDYGFSLLSLTGSAFDLSDRGVSGRRPARPIDGWSYTERGIYRPGETVNCVTLLRDRMGRALQDPLPLTLRLFGPDGSPVMERIVRPQSGAWVQALKLSRAARSGSWTIRLYLGGEDVAVAETGFEVASFVPPRIAVKLVPGTASAEGEGAAVKLQADYLYGSPAGGLKVESSVDCTVDHHPFARWRDYFFGGSFEPEKKQLATMTTGSDGSLLLPIKEVPETLQPLRGRVRAEVSDVDGRVVAATTSIPLLRAPYYVGIKPGKTGDVEADSEALFQLQVVDRNGVPQSREGLRFRILREEHGGEWHYVDDSWEWRETVDDHEITGGAVVTGPGGAQQLRQFVTTGWHRVEVYNSAKELLTSYRFHVGWRSAGGASAPDRVELTALGSGFTPGTKARVKIKSPWPGEASLVLGTEKVASIQNFSMTDKECIVDIPVGSDWGAGMWAMVTVYRPGKVDANGADRAIGVVWLATETESRTLQVKIDAPEKVRPRRLVKVPVSVSGGSGRVFFTLAAVDEGVLGLTDFISPDPLQWFFQRRRPGVAIRDLYSRLLSAGTAPAAVLHYGAGDDNGRRGAPPTNINVVSLFSGVVEVGADGTAVVPLQLPDFNGQLRLMAVAWSAGRLGAASTKMGVSDPVVLSASLPRFLARGDRSFVTVLVENIDGVDGTYQIETAATGAVHLDGPATTAVNLRRGGRQTLLLPIVADRLGSGEVSCTIKGPGGFAVTSRRPISVRGVVLPELKRQYFRLAPAAAMVVDGDSLGEFYPEDASMTLDLNSRVAIDVKGILDQLDRYPYGCLEQLSSRALPLLYVNSLARFYGGTEEKEVMPRLDRAVADILEMQRFNGSFGLWSRSGPEEPWLTCYALDFLTRARAAGVIVPATFIERGLLWIKGRVSGELTADTFSSIAYGHLVLAENGQADRENLRYVYDNFGDRMKAADLARLGAALNLSGERKRGAAALRRAAAEVVDEKRNPRNDCGDYGSRLRDVAVVLALIGEYGEEPVETGPLWESLYQLQKGRQWLSTQEQAALVLAVAFLRESAHFTAIIDGKEVSAENLRLTRSAKELPVKLRNVGDSDLWITCTCRGTPEKAKPPVDKGFRVQRRWYTPDGKALSGEKLQQGDLVVVVVEVTGNVKVPGQAMVINLLPAGLEYEREVTEDGWNARWLKMTNDRILYSDGMDDRFITAWMAGENRSAGKAEVFRTAHLLRVVSPGEFAVPAAEAEMMYAPEIRGSGSSGRLSVSRQAGPVR